MLHDRYLFDLDTNEWTVQRYLEDFDLLRDAAEVGQGGLQHVVAQLHEAGVAVGFPYNPWDTGTNATDGTSDATELATLAARFGFDFVNGDTMHGVPKRFVDASFDAGHALVYEPEVGLPYGNVSWVVASWGYWRMPLVPEVSSFKFLEPRHMVHVCDRWARNKTGTLQAALFNGVGFESWENVWGIFLQMSDRDAEATRRVYTVLRFFAPWTGSSAWRPHFPVHPAVAPFVFASAFPFANSELYTLVNRVDKNLTSTPVLVVPHDPNTVYFDLFRGTKLVPQKSSDGDDELVIGLEASGYGAILASRNESLTSSSEFQALLLQMNAMSERALASYSPETKVLQQTMVPIASAPVQRPDPALPMVRIPACTDYVFVVSGVQIEGGNMPGVDVQFPWEAFPFPGHQHVMDVDSFFLDKYPVTNQNFSAFLNSTGYEPADKHNFLRDWTHNSYPRGWTKKPVTWVSLADARAYCKWAKKRLPHSWEWQLGAQGCNTFRRFPWGNSWQEWSVPQPFTGRTARPGGPDDVDAHPSGQSEYGVMDIIGNTWEFTDEFEDPHTRSVVLRGGSFYRPVIANSSYTNWYFPQALTLQEHGRLLLMADALDRAATVGFRCAADAG